MRSKQETIDEFQSSDTTLIGIVVSIVISVSIFNYSSLSLSYVYLLLALVVIMCFKLDLKFALKVEGKSGLETPVRLNTEKFTKHPYREISRYVDSVMYYDNRWRSALGMTALISLGTFPIIDKKYRYVLPYFLMTVFVIVYHYGNWKHHHSTRFMCKTVIDACNFSDRGKTGYVQSVHI